MRIWLVSLAMQAVRTDRVEKSRSRCGAITIGYPRSQRLVEIFGRWSAGSHSVPARQLSPLCKFELQNEVSGHAQSMNRTTT
jgi:hypothetical protein